MANAQKPKPLQISCSTADCENGLHCFRKTTKDKAFDEGVCQKCGVDLIDWNRVHRRDSTDAAHTFQALKHEFIRHEFFHRALDQKAVNYALRKGRPKLLEVVRHRIESALAPAHPFRDGTQTAFEGNPIFYAQHATACCCRKCLEYWHNIPVGRDLTPAEIDYCAELIRLYLEQRMPDLPNHPQKVPGIKKSRKRG
jgi:hypothetical protein